jgi:hypothetical protein
VVQPEYWVKSSQVWIGHPCSRCRTNLPVDGIMRRQFHRSAKMTRVIQRGAAEKTARIGSSARSEAIEGNIAGLKDSAASVRFRVSLGYEQWVRHAIWKLLVLERRRECQGGWIRSGVIPIRQRPIGRAAEVRYVLRDCALEIQNIHSVPRQEE